MNFLKPKFWDENKISIFSILLYPISIVFLLINILRKNLIKKNSDKDKYVEKYTNKMIYQITKNLDNFFYNIVIANIHDIYNNFIIFNNDENVSDKILKTNYKKLLILIMPILPHFVSECLSKIEPNISLDKVKWPTYDPNLIKDEEYNIVIQINGKKRGLIKMPKNTDEIEIEKYALKNTNIKKYLNNKIIKKKIYVRNKIINFII